MKPRWLALAGLVVLVAPHVHAQPPGMGPGYGNNYSGMSSMPPPLSRATPTVATDEPQRRPKRNKILRSRWWPGNWFGGVEEESPYEQLVRDEQGNWRRQTNPAEVAETNPDFQAAQELFRAEKYSEASKAFKRLTRNYKDMPLEEDALYMYAESLFKADHLPKAQDTYLKLMTKYPTTRYMPQAIQRTYDIAYYWLEDAQLRAQGKEAKHNSFTSYVNFFDKSRPLLDTNGRAIEAIESIQNHDPFGPLSDDAAMMAGGYKFNAGSYLQAAGYYEQLVNDQPKSEHASRAYLLGSQAYLRAYRGPEYDGMDLESAHKLTKAALTRSDLDPESRNRLEADMRAIYLEQAKRDFRTGEHYLQLRRPIAARMYFQKVIENYPDTELAKEAETKLAAIDAKQKAPPGIFKSMGQSVTRQVQRWRGAEVDDRPAPKDAPSVEQATKDLTGVPTTESPADQLTPGPSASPAPVSPGKSLGLPNPFGRD